MSRRANYQITSQGPNHIIITDLGPWDQFMTVTNAAEDVVKELISQLGRRRLFYYDSEGDFGELLIRNGEFNGYAPGPEGIR